MKKVYLVVRLNDGFDFEQENACRNAEHEICYVNSVYTEREEAERVLNLFKQVVDSYDAILVYGEDGFIIDLIH